MAAAGVASRRACEAMIEQGSVEVNGKVVTRLPVFVDPQRDEIRVEGRPISRPGARVYLMMHKPARTLVTTKDEPEFSEAGREGGARVTILDLVQHPAKSRLFPVGRLDYHSTGLVLLTNDGELAARLTHPRHEVAKTYEAVLKRSLSERDVAQFEESLANGGRRATASERAAAAPAQGGEQAVRIEWLGREGGNTTVRLTLHEGGLRRGLGGGGRGQEGGVREFFARLGCPIKKLKRVAIGPLELRGVAAGRWRELNRSEVTALKRAARRGGPLHGKPKDGGPG